MSSEAKKPITTLDVLKALGKPKVLTLLMLGFASGLPFMLVGNTLGFWLREEGLELSTIGFLSWVGMAYTAKWLWSPLVDQFDAPILGKWLGRRRGWVALTQIVLMLSLFGTGFLSPSQQLFGFCLLIVVAAFASATQDIGIDALRIESAADSDELGLLTAASQLGYRGALLLTDAVILIVAADLGWPLSYQVMGLLMGVGMWATWRILEPARPERPALPIGTTLNPAMGVFARLLDGIVGPFVMFMKTHGRMAVLMLVTICLYRLADFMMGPMANPLYVDIGLDKAVVGEIRASVGLIATFFGIAAAGVTAIRYGAIRALIIGAVLGPGSNLAFSWLAWQGGSLPVFGTAMAIDNFSAGFAGTALVTYMSSLTSLGYSATQYALMSSAYALLGKVAKGLSGLAVETLKPHFGLIDAYAWFFVGTALIGIPALLSCLLLAWQTDKRREKPA